MESGIEENVQALIAAGESQSVEFKCRFPDQARDLAKEVAAFASSNDGTILIGVRDDGIPLGLENADSPAGRDGWTKRIQGACAAIRPPVVANVSFHDLDGATIASVRVGKGSAPIYYVQYVPYVRHLSASRPAEPQEVIDRIVAWHNKGPSPESQFLTNLANSLVEVIVRTGEAQQDDRRVNPHLDEARFHFGSLADDIRRNARRTPDSLDGLRERLQALAGHLDGAAHQRITLGSGFQQYIAAVAEAGAVAREVMDRWLDSSKFSAEAVTGVEAAVRDHAGAVQELSDRAKDMAWNGRLRDLQSEAGTHGFNLLRLMAYGVGFGSKEIRAGIREAATHLRAAEAREIYMDGGASVEAVVSNINAAAAALAELLPD